MKKKIILLFCFFSFGMLAQTIEYKYDNNGNRVKRKLYVCPSCPQQGKAAHTDTTKKTEELAARYGVSAYPNPTLDKLNLSLNNVQSNELTSCELINAEGKAIHTQKGLESQNEIDMTNCQQGIYYLRVYIGKDVLLYKIMKVQ